MHVPRVRYPDTRTCYVPPAPIAELPHSTGPLISLTGWLYIAAFAIGAVVIGAAFAVLS